MFDVTIILEKVKQGLRKITENKIKRDHSIAEDTLEDHNNIAMILIIGYFFKTAKLVIIILNISYFLAMFWIAYCWTTREMHIISYQNYELDTNDFFYDYFGLIKMYDEDHHGSVSMANFRTGLIGIYFAFTSLSTVGFGDYHPRSDSERLMCAGILLAGVATFSIILGNFIDILNEFKAINEDLGDGD